ncbi:hypothetical protein BDW22DRAFT_1344629 [Trametopsis cervina]|nr:hypothetical protein BDW22DRAFT_1344629 [Trametopsis cervina]
MTHIQTLLHHNAAYPGNGLTHKHPIIQLYPAVTLLTVNSDSDYYLGLDVRWTLSLMRPCARGTHKSGQGIQRSPISKVTGTSTTFVPLQFTPGILETAIPMSSINDIRLDYWRSGLKSMTHNQCACHSILPTLCGVAVNVRRRLSHTTRGCNIWRAVGKAIARGSRLPAAILCTVRIRHLVEKPTKAVFCCASGVPNVVHHCAQWDVLCACTPVLLRTGALPHHTTSACISRISPTADNRQGFPCNSARPHNWRTTASAIEDFYGL